VGWQDRYHLPKDIQLFPSSRLRLGKILGKGTFGVVLSAEALDLSGSGTWEKIAVKMCKGEREAMTRCTQDSLRRSYK